MASMFKKIGNKIKIIDMVLMVEKVIRGEICHNLRYAEAHNKHLKSYDL